MKKLETKQNIGGVLVSCKLNHGRIDSILPKFLKAFNSDE